MNPTPRVVYSVPPDLRWDRRALKWIVLREFWVHWYRPGFAPWVFTVPAEFRTDLASIPKRARGLIAQVGPNLQAAVTHDWCYGNRVFWRDHEMTRAEADLLFLHGMKSLGVPWWRRRVMYGAVRVGGEHRWLAGHRVKVEEKKGEPS